MQKLKLTLQYTVHLYAAPTLAQARTILQFLAADPGASKLIV
jgi:hypothetical protein